LKSSVVSLCKKVLAYREIDIPFAVACLCALPLECIVKELKASVPITQNNFFRLQTISSIGEEIAHIFDDESLLLLFQGLQTNAKWWKILTSLGVNIDLRMFQSPDSQIREPYIRSILPDMLKQSQCDLELAYEYCQNFDVPPETAALTYIEQILSTQPSAAEVFDNIKINKLKSAAIGLDETLLIKTLQSILKHIHSLDYEKIYFISIWLLDILPSSTDTDTDTEIDREFIRENIHTVHDIQQSSTYCRKLYHLFVDIINYLYSLNIPNESLQVVRSSKLLLSHYTNISGKYLYRLPFWELLNNPWNVLDPILSSSKSSVFSDKLLPLCYLIGANKEEYNARAIFSKYQNFSKSFSDSSVGHVTFLNAIDFVVSEVAEKLPISIFKFYVWEWIISKEIQVNNIPSAICALEHAIAVADIFQSSVENEARVQEYKTAFSNMLLKLQLEECIKKFCFSMGCECIFEQLKIYISRPKELLKIVLLCIMEYCWELQLRHAYNSSSSLDIWNILNSQPVTAVLEFLQSARKYFMEIYRLSKLATIESFDSFLGNIVVALITEVRIHSRAINISSESVKSLWLFADNPAITAPTIAEFRRLEDIFAAYNLGILFCLCETNR
jgi:hypothetical protein